MSRRTPPDPCPGISNLTTVFARGMAISPPTGVCCWSEFSPTIAGDVCLGLSALNCQLCVGADQTAWEAGPAVWAPCLSTSGHCTRQCALGLTSILCPLPPAGCP